MRAVLSAMTMIARSKRCSVAPSAIIRSRNAATNAAMTAEVELSGPAIANGSELRSPMTKPAIAAERNVTATP